MKYIINNKRGDLFFDLIKIYLDNPKDKENKINEIFEKNHYYDNRANVDYLSFKIIAFIYLYDEYFSQIVNIFENFNKLIKKANNSDFFIDNFDEDNTNDLNIINLKQYCRVMEKMLKNDDYDNKEIKWFDFLMDILYSIYSNKKNL
ncbi:MAG: hypothetical protein ACRCRP_02550 [Metamycoplasmataceae bacterium]